MKNINTAIARQDLVLRCIPTAVLKQLSILRFIKEQTGADGCFLQLDDDLGRYIGGLVWPLPNPWRMKKMKELGPAFGTLGLCNEIFETHWDHTPGVAFTIPDGMYERSLVYRYIYGPMGSHHTLLYGYPTQNNGHQLFVIPVRGKTNAPFEASCYTTLELLCRHYKEILCGTSPLGHLTPRHAKALEHSVELTADFRPIRPSLHVLTLFHLFYDEAVSDERGPLLPYALKKDIENSLDVFMRPARSVIGDFSHAFTKSKRGRVLCLVVRSLRNGGYKLTLNEDHFRHQQLSRMIAACRQLPRDRTSIFSACLAVAEGVQANDKIAARAGFGSLKSTSALRLVNKARQIVADAMQPPAGESE